MPFTKKVRAPEASAEPQSERSPVQMSAQARLAALVNERVELELRITALHEERRRLMRGAEAPAIEAISTLALQIDAAKLHLEWLAHQVSSAQVACEAK